VAGCSSSRGAVSTARSAARERASVPAEAGGCVGEAAAVIPGSTLPGLEAFAAKRRRRHEREPDRKPPSGWTEERMVDAAAAAFRGDEPELPSHRLLRLTADERERGNAADAMRGFGVAIECFSKQTWESISKSGSSLFVPTIKERQFQQADFHFPVLDRNSILAAGSAEQLDAWMCGIEVYVRASAEDKGILILSKLPLEGLLQSTQELLESA